MGLKQFLSFVGELGSPFDCSSSTAPGVVLLSGQFAPNACTNQLDMPGTHLKTGCRLGHGGESGRAAAAVGLDPAPTVAARTGAGAWPLVSSAGNSTACAER
jgi:hypothetical protein